MINYILISIFVKNLTSELEKIFRANGVKFEYSSTILKMKNSSQEYKSLEGTTSSYFDQKEAEQTTLKLELIDEHSFVVRYLPRKPNNQILTALSVELYTKLLSPKSGKVAGRYEEKFLSWVFPLSIYFDFVTKMNKLELRNEKNLKLERLPSGIETYLRRDANGPAKYVEPQLPEVLNSKPGFKILGLRFLD